MALPRCIPEYVYCAMHLHLTDCLQTQYGLLPLTFLVVISEMHETHEDPQDRYDLSALGDLQGQI